jgi:hypothetical protein
MGWTGIPAQGGITMGKVLWGLVLIVPLFLAAPLHALSYPPLQEEPGYAGEEDALRVGTRVLLFHSGTEDVKNAVHVGDVLLAYREAPTSGQGQLHPQAKIRITGLPGGYFFEGEVLEGHLYPGYLALKGKVACFVAGRAKPKH